MNSVRTIQQGSATDLYVYSAANIDAASQAIFQAAGIAHFYDADDFPLQDHPSTLFYGDWGGWRLHISEHHDPRESGFPYRIEFETGRNLPDEITSVRQTLAERLIRAGFLVRFPD